jgi:hypothetical protein
LGTAIIAGPMVTVGQRVRRVDAAGVGLEGQQRDVLQHDGQAQRHQQDVLVLAVAGAVDDAALQRVAGGEHHRHHRQQAR